MVDCEWIFLVFRIARHKKLKISDAIAKRKMFMNRLSPPRVAATADPLNRMEKCPKIKKKKMKTVEMRMALGRLLINRKLMATTTNENVIEKRKGRMAIFASTSRKFQVSNARLG